ncbi:MAG: RagB/SusD family nutrient uptake outer membrane protein [Proteobacteria bacterium]|nr:RagB/SusD family nutrient uptake outer membrane protein [Pseudomonadota bacterium]
MRLLKNAKIAVLLPLIIVASACDDLVLEPHSAVSNDAYFKQIGDYEAAIIGVYDQISIADYYGRSLYLMADIMGEDVKQNGSANRYQEFADFEGQIVTGHGFEQELWAEGYEGINMLNMIIQAEFDGSTSVQADYQQIMGEVYALRGLIYFDLVRMYGQHYTFTSGGAHPGVPIVLEPDVTLLPARNTVGEVYTQAISDLTRGISMMSQTRGGSFMMTASAAQAVLSRIYLYMEDWANVVTMSNSVISSGRYALVEGQAYVDQFKAGGSSEAIFEIQNTDTDGNNALGSMYRATGYGDYLPAKDLLDLIDPADVRMQMFQIDPGLAGIYASYRVMKWPSSTSTDNIPVIRLSEVYLNRAEAHARSGNTAGAQADLNMIRQRGLSSAPAVVATGQALLDAIALERRIELGYEGHRIHDLMRYRMDINRVDVTGDVAFMGYPCQFCILPIPQYETDANPNMTQNAGY